LDKKKKPPPKGRLDQREKDPGFQPINFLRAPPARPMSPVPSNSRLDGSGTPVVTAVIVRVSGAKVVKVPGPLYGPPPVSCSEQVSVPDKFVRTLALIAVGLNIVAEPITVHPTPKKEPVGSMNVLTKLVMVVVEVISVGSSAYQLKLPGSVKV
jgi:hypothetical protein